MYFTMFLNKEDDYDDDNDDDDDDDDDDDASNKPPKYRSSLIFVQPLFSQLMLTIFFLFPLFYV